MVNLEYSGHNVFVPIFTEDEDMGPKIEISLPENDVAPMTFEEVGRYIGALTDEKQAAYGDSYGKSGDVLLSLYPDGVRPDQYADMLAIVRVIDKLFRIATQKNAFGESPWKDIVGYGLLGVGKK